MTKTNRFTLIATILLGVLLYTIIRFANDLNVAWDGSEKKPPPVKDNMRASAQPVIATTADLRIFLDKNSAINDIDVAAVLDGYADWSEARGFTGRNRLFGSPDTSVVGDNTGLQALSNTGDAAASQALAAQLLFDDLFGAIELFRQSAEQGSTFALLRIGSLLESLDAVETGHEAADSEQRRRIVEIARRGVDNSLRLTAYGYVVAAIRDGGAPIVDHPLLAWLDRLHEDTTNDERVAVCEWSERTLLDIARARARWGKPAITTQPPAVFFTIPDLQDRLPCNDTAFPIETLLDLTHCTITPVRNANDKQLDLYLCPSG